MAPIARLQRNMTQQPQYMQKDNLFGNNEPVFDSLLHDEFRNMCKASTVRRCSGSFLRTLK